jgi:nucleoside-diphosphate-sugar epimerase
MRPCPSGSRYLITGATGFIGRHLVEALLAQFGAGAIVAMTHTHRGKDEQRAFERWRSTGISLIECDLLNLQQQSPLPPEFDVVYHLAGHTETGSPSASFRVNSEGTRNLVRWLGPALRGKRLIYASTLATVDSPRFRHAIDEATVCHPKTAYGRTKLAGEESIRSLQAEFGFDCTILRLCTIVGTGFRPTGMFGVFPRMLARNAFGTRLNWPGRISLMGASDLVRILTTLPVCPQTRNELYVMSNGENPSVDHVLDEMATAFGYPRNKVRVPLWLWRVTGALCWRITSLPMLPHRTRTFFWRLSHMIYDGVCADSSRLDAVLFRPRYQPFRECLQAIYGRTQPVEAGAADDLSDLPVTTRRTAP